MQSLVICQVELAKSLNNERCIVRIRRKSRLDAVVWELAQTSLEAHFLNS